MKKHSKLLTLLLAASIIVCSLVAVSLSSSAETATGEVTALEIEYSNVAYNAMTQLAFTLKGTLAEGMEAGIAVWESDVTGEKTLANASYTNFEYGTLGGKTYWLTDGIAANEMSLALTVAPIVRNADTKDGVALAGPLYEHSIYDYVASRLDDGDVTAKQAKLYANLVYYGNYAEKVINGSVNIPVVIAKGGGEAGNLGNTLTFADANGNALLRANAQNEDGEYFLYWLDESDNKCYDRVRTVTVTEGNNVYTAVYGAKADSAYADSADLNALTVGALNLVPGSATIQASGEDFYVTGETSHLNSLLTVKGFTKVTSADDKTALLGDALSIKEENGKKYISFEKNFIKSGLTGARVVINNPGTRVEERIDLDIRINSTSWLGMDWHLYFTDGTSNKEKHPGATYDSNGNFAINGVSAGNFKHGERFTLTMEIVEAGVNFYVNGSYVTTLDTGFGADYNNSAAFRGFGITGNSGCDFDIDYLAVNFVDTDLFN